RFPVTNTQYRRFIRETGRPGPMHKIDWAIANYNWTGQQFRPGTADQPVVLVNRQEAAEYCRWRGARLPTEVEWEKAARGPDGQKYPWGDRWEEGACPATDSVDIPPRVGMCPQRASPYGAQEMIGGVLEWVEDFYRAYDRTHLHANANEWITTFGDVSYVLKGSPAGQAGPGTTAASRSGHADNMRAKIGFRCAMNADINGSGAPTAPGGQK
ncbi:MAG: sulfatase activating formylglycine-generating enzyme, partial [Myxococcota bacterium]